MLLHFDTASHWAAACSLEQHVHSHKPRNCHGEYGSRQVTTCDFNADSPPWNLAVRFIKSLAPRWAPRRGEILAPKRLSSAATAETSQFVAQELVIGFNCLYSPAYTPLLRGSSSINPVTVCQGSCTEHCLREMERKRFITTYHVLTN